jgi:hypothetical protein
VGHNTITELQTRIERNDFRHFLQVNVRETVTVAGIGTETTQRDALGRGHGTRRDGGSAAREDRYAG